MKGDKIIDDIEMMQMAGNRELAELKSRNPNMMQPNNNDVLSQNQYNRSHGDPSLYQYMTFNATQ